MDYYTNKKMEVKLTVPDRMLAGRADAQLCFDLEINGKVISSNHYAYRIAEKAWAAQPAKSVKGSVVVYNASDLSKSLFEALGG